MIYINRLNKEILKNNISYVLSDFDHTISTFETDSWGLFDRSNLVSDEYKKASSKLYNKYHTIEVDNRLSTEYKKEMMLKWTIEQIELFSKYGIDINVYNKVIRESNDIIIRDGFQNFSKVLYDLGIPLYIVSGGLTDPIINTLEKNNSIFPNIKVIANRIKCEDSKIIGLKDPILYGGNKSIISRYISNKKTGLLFGDLPSDIDMGVGLNTINCGFAKNEQIEEYNQLFDITLTENSSFSQVAKLLIKK